MDEFEKIRAFSVELGKKTEEAVVAENTEETEKEQAPQSTSEPDRADFLEGWSSQTENTEETRTLSKTFWLVLFGVSCLFICLIVVVYLLLKGPMQNDEVITIAPTQKPVKIRPENPGGMVIPDQDKVIYSRISQDTIPAKVEKLFPDEEEKPVMPQVVEEPTTEIPVFEEVEEVQVIQGEPLQDETQFPAKETTQEKKAEAKAPVPEKVEVKKDVAPKAVKAEWKVQLFSSTDKAKVEKQWQTISKKHKALVSNMPMQIVPVEISGKGTYHRLYVGAFETREMANNLCAKLKKQKQECIPAK